MRVSILTTTYNRGDALRYAIESARSQSFAEREHIIVGDACTDGTEALIKSFQSPRPLFVNRERRSNEPARAVNDGFALSQAPLIAFLNDEDLWFADHLERLTEEMQTSGADFVYAPLAALDEAGVPRCGVVPADMRYDPSQFIPPSLWLMKRELMQDLAGWREVADAGMNPSQDFLVRASRSGAKMVCAPTVTALVLAGAGADKDASLHSALFAAMQGPGFRERLLTRAVLVATRESAALQREAERLRAESLSTMGRLSGALRSRFAPKPARAAGGGDTPQ